MIKTEDPIPPPYPTARLIAGVMYATATIACEPGMSSVDGAGSVWEGITIAYQGGGSNSNLRASVISRRVWSAISRIANLVFITEIERAS